MKTTTVTAKSIDKWAANAQPGEAAIYHSGGCLHSRSPESAAGKAWSLHMRGVVDLVQRRASRDDLEDGGRFDYIAVKRKHVVPQREDRTGSAGRVW